MNQILNLARKWRSRQFEEIVGQELSVKLLKNSLYRGQFFPVYLFSGQRGCGKTTTARVFAAAINCFKLQDFQKNPQQIILPCLDCVSCVSMISGNHPDFIEIDAASNTGVDNVRQIIDAASLMPVLAKKKIYLIDEAHMLSKAAFNALLKILEEPPTNVVFMLATTELHKIIDTVKSRCFQLFFPSIEKNKLIEYLAMICSKEEIAFDSEGLKLIAQESEGSLRDAINLMERVRLAYATIDKKAVLEILGYIDDARLIELFGLILQGDIKEILSYIKEISLTNFTPTIVWKRFVEIIRSAIWVKYAPDLNNIGSISPSTLSTVPVQNLVRMLEIAYEYEPLLNKTTAAHEMLEMMIIKMSLGSIIERREPIILKSIEKITESPKTNVENVISVKNNKPTIEDSPWSIFNKEVEKLNDPLIASIFKQGKLIKTDLQNRTIQVEFPPELKFFEETLNNTKKLWQPLVEQVFGQNLDLDASYIEIQSASVQPDNTVSKPVQINTPKFAPEKKSEKVILKPSNELDIHDKEKWKITNMILEVFPGTVNQIENN